MSVFPLWYAPAVPPELGGGGAQRKFGRGHAKNYPALRAGVCASQLQNRVGAYAVVQHPCDKYDIIILDWHFCMPYNCTSLSLISFLCYLFMGHES